MIDLPTGRTQKCNLKNNIEVTVCGKSHVAKVSVILVEITIPYFLGHITQQLYMRQEAQTVFTAVVCRLFGCLYVSLSNFTAKTLFTVTRKNASASISHREPDSSPKDFNPNGKLDSRASSSTKFETNICFRYFSSVLR